MEIQLHNLSIRERIGQWFRSRLSQIDQYDTRMWRIAHIGVWLVCCMAATLAGLGMPTGFGALFDTGLSLFLVTVGMALCSYLLAVVLALLRAPIPRFFTGSMVYTGVLLYCILYYASLGIYASLLLSFAVVMGSALCGCFIGWIVISRIIIREKLLVIGSLIAMAIALVVFIIPLFQHPAEHTSGQEWASPHHSVAQIAAENPGEPGSYDYQYFTYGSGEDRWRKGFAAEVELVSTDADASDYITRWPRLRSLFWGFNQTALPLNGRVWMPEGEGPFPLVLMVHGNHLMEQFSDEGYGYLGELLASRGFVAVSIDENFLNYSVWSGIPDQDMKVRAWILLKHLQQILSFAEQPGTPFYERIDGQQIALLGHSRGGQAAAMAADRARWFSADQTLTTLDRIDIRTVIALSPTDKAVDRQYSKLHNVNYLTLHGAKDADVNNFNGGRQYVRTTYSANSANMKASLYIADANHSQFNTEWGRMDQSMPGGIFLNRRDTMDAADQREVTKVAVSAFLEVTLHGNESYAGFFRDFRNGPGWLPTARIFSRYERGSFQELTRYDIDSSRSTLRNGMTATTHGMSDWGIEEMQLRQQKDKHTQGMVLEWNGDSSYSIHISDAYRNKLRWNSITGLVFSMANMQGDLVESHSGLSPPQVIVEIESDGGATVRVPLDSIMPVQPLPRTIYTTIPWLLEKRMKDGKYKEDTEPVFQTYEIAFQLLKETNALFSPAEITRVTFYFTGESGKVALDDIGWSQESKRF